MKHPMIGITMGAGNSPFYYSCNLFHAEALMRAGAVPVMLPLMENEEIMAFCVERLDGVLLTGGTDVDPAEYQEEPLPACGSIDPGRDRSELALTRWLAQRGDLPVLGICRGLQVMNVALGGSLYQDLFTQYPGSVIAHRQHQPENCLSHYVQIDSDSLLYRILGENRIRVCSLHHQAVKQTGRGVKVCATAPDGVVEAICLEGHPFFLGVQWHPERTLDRDKASYSVFEGFVHACRKD